MKRTIFAMAILAASVAVADDVSSSNVLGLLPVTSSAKRTIVSVPWCAMSATDDSAIQVSNLVKTANLTVGDMLHYVNSDGSYLSWQLTNDVNNIKYWQSVNIVKENNEVSYTPAANSQSVARGNSIVLIRQDVTSPTFYLYGQVGTNTSVSSTIVKGSEDDPAYTLIASPNTSVWTVNGSDHEWSNIGAKDNLFVYNDSGMMIPLYWNGSIWGASNDVWTTVGNQKVRTGKAFAEYNTSIPAGTGVWYVSNGGGENPGVTWNQVPSK